MKPTFVPPLTLTLALALSACQDATPPSSSTPPALTIAGNEANACTVALNPHAGSDTIDAEIARLQQHAQGRVTPAAHLERLGWAYVAKAQRSFDPGFFELAEQTALCMSQRSPGDPSATLLRGHALHNLHRFSEAEVLARGLSETRGLWLDHALLGDVLLEQGKLQAAATAYQEMMDLKPGALTYIRAANIRWLTGDLAGAIEVARMAAAASGSHDASAWINTRLAVLERQAGEDERALRSIDTALRSRADYPPALLVKGLVALSKGAHRSALGTLQKAASINPLPEYQWALMETYLELDDAKAAASLNQRMLERGAVDDARTYALYLASTGQRVDEALAHARVELEIRRDTFTLDTLAWAYAANGDMERAHELSTLAVGKGIQDARVFYHAGVIASALGKHSGARRWLADAMAIRQMLLPSERRHLREEFAALESQISRLDAEKAGTPGV